MLISESDLKNNALKAEKASQIVIKDKLEPKRNLKVAVFDQRKCRTRPHRHDGYLELVLLLQTSGRHFIDGHEIKVNTPCMLIIRKDNVHHWELNTPVDGYVILVKKQFFDISLDFELSYLLEQLYGINTIPLDDSSVLAGMVSILEQEGDRICQEGLMKAILAKLVTYTKSKTIGHGSSKHLYLRFCELINSGQPIHNHVAHYAALLHTSPQNLNAACKKASEQTASQLLASYIIKEGKRLLYYTNKTIAEIAYDLGFTDKSNFTKYFKRFVGIGPKAYRDAKLDG
ncbi:AraC family transcriptional regulator [Sphingobacterium lactis]|uniref:AraC family transcriptional regulator n=1 Tax=Sphingobacterium lactis TaxID=797291 RepID=UPI003EC78ECB